uniref:Uncharacterized protein n=2 Tax=Mantoniella antarctica TaxID=81844 RepID=A0A7S0SN08_9CHLO|mmetsp:Transcript_29799/g.74516  ORF Transcript_29799/g.74516 Transcript_29799/m.74516 type:complete len:209 (+) Transcript_29799:424-1050(+)
MVGRGAVQDPLLFRRIAAALGGPDGGAQYRRSVSAMASRRGEPEPGGGSREGSHHGYTVNGGGLGTEWWELSREEEAKEVVLFLRRFAAEVFTASDEPAAGKQRRRVRPEAAENFQLGKLKQVCKYLFASNQSLAAHITRVLGTTLADGTPQGLLDDVEDLVMRQWGVPEDVLVDAFSMRTSYADGVAEEEKRGRLATRGVGKDIVRL